MNSVNDYITAIIEGRDIEEIDWSDPKEIKDIIRVIHHGANNNTPKLLSAWEQHGEVTIEFQKPRIFTVDQFLIDQIIKYTGDKNAYIQMTTKALRVAFRPKK